jgi:hypothetical protein
MGYGCNWNEFWLPFVYSKEYMDSQSTTEVDTYGNNDH